MTSNQLQLRVQLRLDLRQLVEHDLNANRTLILGFP
jgi:hypothetical protein